jgi:PadR family transcriptional regulator PadR
MGRTRSPLRADRAAPTAVGAPSDWNSISSVDKRAFAYMPLQYMASPVPDRELKKGSAELMILALLEDRARHGYEIGQLIDLRSHGAIRFNVASLYPLLYRLEKRKWIRGRWVEKPGQRRRRYYRLTTSGKKVLLKQRAGWREFVEAINLITGIQHA